MKPIIVVVDDFLSEDDPLLVELRRHYDDVVLLSDAEDAKNYVRENLARRMILLLDVQLSGDPDGETGHDLLSYVRELSSSIPVLLWSGKQQKAEDLQASLNNHAFAFLKQGTPFSEIVAKVREAEAWQNTDVAPAIEDWMESQKEQLRNDEPYLITTSGKSYTFRELLQEVRLGTRFGREVEEGFRKLTINRLARHKEKLDDSHFDSLP